MSDERIDTYVFQCAGDDLFAVSHDMTGETFREPHAHRSGYSGVKPNLANTPRCRLTLATTSGVTPAGRKGSLVGPTLLTRADQARVMSIPSVYASYCACSQPLLAPNCRTRVCQS